MDIAGECRAPVLDQGAIEIAHVGIPQSGGDAAVGDDTTDVEILNAGFSQHPFEPRHVEGRVGDFFNRKVGRSEFLDERVAPLPRAEITLAEKRPQRFQVRRDQRLCAPAGHKREMRRDDKTIARAKQIDQRLQTCGKSRDSGIGAAAARIGAVSVDEIVLQVADEKRGLGKLGHRPPAGTDTEAAKRID